VPGDRLAAGNPGLGGGQAFPNLAKMPPVPGPLETALFARLIDHAPLFPPARLPLPEALDEHRQARASEHGWIVRRFVAPASVLGQLNGEALALSIVVDEPDANLDDSRIESVEIPPSGGPVSFGGETYVEGLPASEAEAARCRLKVRCGPAAPSVAELADVVRSCRGLGVPFKATAGLHHAVRQDGQHGFVNLLAAAVFGDEETALAEDDPAAFRVDDAFRWRDRAASVSEVERGRRLFVAFGSCSFSEPVDDLRTLGFLRS
jgi:hypothetical protein